LETNADISPPFCLASLSLSLSLSFVLLFFLCAILPCVWIFLVGEPRLASHVLVSVFHHSAVVPPFSKQDTRSDEARKRGARSDEHEEHEDEEEGEEGCGSVTRSWVRSLVAWLVLPRTEEGDTTNEWGAGRSDPVPSFRFVSFRFVSFCCGSLPLRWMPRTKGT